MGFVVRGVIVGAILSLLAACSDETNLAPPKGAISAMIFFDLDVVTVTTTGVEILSALAQKLVANSQTVDLRGHADAAESANSIAKARVEAVRKLLIDKGVSARRITGGSEGSTRPMQAGGSPMNRRVEVYVN